MRIENISLRLNLVGKSSREHQKGTKKKVKREKERKRRRIIGEPLQV